MGERYKHPRDAESLSNWKWEEQIKYDRNGDGHAGTWGLTELGGESFSLRFPIEATR